MQTGRRYAMLSGALLLFSNLVVDHVNAADDPVTLRVSYAPGHLTNLYETIAQRFMSEHPDIKIVFDAPSADYATLTQQLLRQKITGDLPDVAHDGLNQMRTLAKRNVAVPLDDFAAEDPEWKNLGVAENLLSYSAYNGKTYALPFAISVPVIFYNADLVSRAGGDPDKLPTDWDAIIALSEKIAALDPKISGHYVEYTNGGWSFQMLLGSFGGHMMNREENAVSFNGPEGLNAMKLLQRLGQEGQPAWERNQARQAFGAGTLGMLATTSAELSVYQKAAGDRFVVKVGHFPTSSKNVVLPAAGNGIVMLTRDERKQRAAWEYIKYAIGATGQLLMVQNTGYVPVNVKAMKDPNGIGGLFKNNPQLSIAAERLPMMAGWYSFPGDNDGRIVKLVEDSAQAVVTLKQSPDIALTELADKVKTLIPN